MRWAGLALRRLRNDPVPSAVLAVVVLVTAAIAASGPVLLSRTADSALRSRVALAAPIDANFELASVTRIAAGGASPLAGVDATGTRDLEGLPARLRDLVAQRSTVVETPRWAVSSTAGSGLALALRISGDVAAHVRLVSGRAPGGDTTTAQYPADAAAPAGPAVVFEAMLAAPTAARVHVGTGDLLALEPDLTDPLARGRTLRVAVRIVGLFEVADPGAAFWLDDRTVAGPGLEALNSDLALVVGTALLAPDAYPALLAATDARIVGGASQPALPFRYQWRAFVDPRRLSASTAPALLADLRRAETLFPADSGSAVQVGSVGPTPFSASGIPLAVPAGLTTGLPRVLAAHLDAWRSTLALLTLAASGPAAVAVAALGLIALVAASRRRRSTLVWERRGARRPQVVMAALTEAAAIAVPAAAVGTWLALLGGGDAGVPVLLGAAVGVIAVVLVVGVSLAGQIPGGGTPPSRAAPRRLTRRGALEILVVALAIGATGFLRERGISAPSPAAGTAGAGGDILPANPVAAAAPLLLGAAAALLTARAMPVGLRFVAGLAARRPGFVPALALRRATRTGAGDAVLAVLLAAAAIAAFSISAADQLGRAADAAAWQAVGADQLVTRDAGAPPGGLAGPESAAAAAARDSLPDAAVIAAGLHETVPFGPAGDQADLLALDAAYSDVVTGTPGVEGLPAGALAAVLSATTGSGGQPLPAIVSAGARIGRAQIAVGDVTVLSLRARRVPVRVVAVTDHFPSLPAGNAFVVLSLPALQAIVTRPLAPTLLYVRDTPGAGTALAAEIDAGFPGAIVAVRADVERSTLADPLVGAVSSGLAWAALAAALYAALAAVAALVIAGDARAVETAHLRALGMSRRQQLGLAVVEQGPVAIAAFVVGLGAGVACFALLLPGLGLGALVGAAPEPAATVSGAPLAGLLAALTAVGSAAILVGTALEQRGSLAAAARREVG